MRATVLGVSGPKYKTYNFGGKEVTHEFRYVKAQDQETSKIYLIRMSVKSFQEIKDAEGKLLNHNGTRYGSALRSGDIVNVEHFATHTFVDPQGVEFIYNPKIMTVVGHVEEERTEEFTLDQINFYNWGVIARKDNVKLVMESEPFEMMTGLPTDWHLNKYKDKLADNQRKTATITATAKFKVYYGWSLEKKFYYGNGKTWKITSDNLLPFKQIVSDDVQAKKMKKFVQDLRAILASRFAVTDKDVLEVMEKLQIKMTPEEAREYVKSVFWKGGYEEEYFDWLRSKSKEIRWSREGFVFIMSRSLVVLEEPEWGKATYVFIGTPEEVTGKLQGLREADNTGRWKESLLEMKKEVPEKFHWYIDRAIHTEFDSWKEKMEEIMHCPEQ